MVTKTLNVPYSLCEEGDMPLDGEYYWLGATIGRYDAEADTFDMGNTFVHRSATMYAGAMGDWPEPAEPDLDVLYADDPTVFKIPDANLDRLVTRLTWLNKRASKLNAEPITHTLLGTCVERDDKKGTVTHYTFVRVIGQPIKLAGGWTFVATLEHTEAGNIIRAVPEATIPTRYRDAEPACDHCQLDRRRKDTYIVQNADGDFMQVGRTCLKDFVGHRDPAKIAAWMEYLAELAGYIEAEFLGGLIQPTGTPANLFLGLTAACIRLWGWTPKSKVRYTGGSATVDETLWWLRMIETNRADSRDNYAVGEKDTGAQMYSPNGKPIQATDDDFAIGRSALQWARHLADEDMGTSDYLYNLHIIAQTDDFLWRHTGLAASMVQAYQRHLGETLKRLDAPESNYQGEVKKRQVWTGLLCTHIMSWETDWGVTHLHKFADEAGNIFIWKTGTHMLDQGSTYAGKATVKAHDEYKDVKQTVLTRFAWEKIDDRPVDGNGESNGQ